MTRRMVRCAPRCSRSFDARSGSWVAWSCTPVKPHWLRVWTISSKAELTKTPIFSSVLGRCRVMAATCSAVTRRGLSAKTKPTASAPASYARSASLRLVLAQILIHIELYLQKLSERCAGRRLTQQGLAYQECVISDGPEPLDIVGGVDATFGYVDCS